MQPPSSSSSLAALAEPRLQDRRVRRRHHREERQLRPRRTTSSGPRAAARSPSSSVISCVPIFPPTECDPDDDDRRCRIPTTERDDLRRQRERRWLQRPFACPAPAAGKQTICGQLYDIEDRHAVPGHERRPAAACAARRRRRVRARSRSRRSTRSRSATSPTHRDAARRTAARTSTTAAATASTDIAQPASPFIGLGIDDANADRIGAEGRDEHDRRRGRPLQPTRRRHGPRGLDRDQGDDGHVDARRRRPAGLRRHLRRDLPHAQVRR